MSKCCNFNSFGITSLIDSQSAYWGGGLPIFYRTRSYDLETVGEGVREMGFSVMSLTGAPVTGAGGYTDQQICPQPSVKMLSMRFIEAAIAAGTALRWGAIEVTISHAWVKSIQQANGYTDPKQVFIDDRFIGFYYDNRLFQVVSYTHDDLFGGIVQWNVIMQANELK